jgi:hypothetical protein
MAKLSISNLTEIIREEIRSVIKELFSEAKTTKETKESDESSEKVIYTVYGGYDSKGQLAYIGSTTQKPNLRFNHHKYMGKKLNFKVLKQFETREAMVKFEQAAMDKYHPSQNKRKEALSNLPVTPEELEKRKSDPTWCKSCLKRHVNKGYDLCYNCERFGGSDQ